MKNSEPKLEQYRIKWGTFASDATYGMMGAFQVPSPIDNARMKVISDNGVDSKWEHVSVSRVNRCPNWPEMCFIKDLFWDDEEIVIQYHPPKSKYINNSKYVLHMWRPVKNKVPMPPTIFV